MRLTCYPTSNTPPRIVIAPPGRSWMDRGASRCLPLNIANAHGWFVLNTVPFIADWNGEAGIEAVSVKACGGDAAPLARSHFGLGVLTFSVPALLRTEPGYDLFVTGPLNEPKDAIQPLTGVIETDWAEFTFTMNWKFTRKFTPVTFERDEPFCMIFPVKRGLLEEFDPDVRAMKDDPPLHEAYSAFAQSRAEFNKEVRVSGSKAWAQGWQKHYFRGESQLSAFPTGHRTSLKLKTFKSSAGPDGTDGP